MGSPFSLTALCLAFLLAPRLQAQRCIWTLPGTCGQDFASACWDPATQTIRALRDDNLVSIHPRTGVQTILATIPPHHEYTDPICRPRNRELAAGPDGSWWFITDQAVLQTPMPHPIFLKRDYQVRRWSPDRGVETLFVLEQLDGDASRGQGPWPGQSLFTRLAVALDGTCFLQAVRWDGGRVLRLTAPREGHGYHQSEEIQQLAPTEVAGLGLSPNGKILLTDGLGQLHSLVPPAKGSGAGWSRVLEQEEGQAAGTPVLVGNNLTIAPDGKVYGVHEANLRAWTPVPGPDGSACWRQEPVASENPTLLGTPSGTQACNLARELHTTTSLGPTPDGGVLICCGFNSTRSWDPLRRAIRFIGPSGPSDTSLAGRVDAHRQAELQADWAQADRIWDGLARQRDATAPDRPNLFLPLCKASEQGKASVSPVLPMGPSRQIGGFLHDTSLISFRAALALEAIRSTSLYRQARLHLAAHEPFAALETPATGTEAAPEDTQDGAHGSKRQRLD
jgi:hypothetical protein